MALRNSLIIATIGFVFGYTSLMLADQSYIQDSRIEKSLLFGAIYASICFVIALVAEFCIKAAKKKSKKLSKVLTTFSIIIVILFSVFTISRVYSAIIWDSFSDISIWTDTRIENTVLTCTGSVLNNQPNASFSYANKYCSCVFEKVSKRWSYGEYMKNPNDAINTLKNEKVILACQIVANSKNKLPFQ